MPELARRCRLRRRARPAFWRSTARAGARREPSLLRTADPPLAGRRPRRARVAAHRQADRDRLDGDLWLVMHLMIAGRLHWRPRRRRSSPAATRWPRSTSHRHAGPDRSRHQTPRVAARAARQRRRWRRSIPAASTSSPATWRRFAGARCRESHAQARAHRSAHRRRHRQRVLRRDPARRAAFARSRLTHG